jgi:hypothetical protein
MTVIGKPAMTVISRAGLPRFARNDGRVAMTGLLTVVIVILLVISLAPLGVFALPDEGGASGDLNVTVEYRYSEGESVSVPSSITRFGREYQLVSSANPVLESSLPQTRTYTYKIEGLLSEEDIAELSDVPGLVLTPVLVEAEREVDKTQVFTDLPTNDLEQDGIPEYQEFEVSSALAEDGIARVSLKRAGVSFKVVEKSNGLPEKYEATVVYRGMETFRETGYYSVDVTYETSVTEGSVAQYVVVAVYEPVDKPAEAATRGDTNTEIDPGLEPEKADSEFSAEDEAKFSQQTGNPFLDILNGNVPLGSFFSKGAWSLLSAVFSLISVILSVFMIFGIITKRRALKAVEAFKNDLSRRKKLASASRVIAVLLGAVVPVVWVILDDFGLPMVWLNRWTSVVGAIFLVQVVMFVIYEMAASKVDSAEKNDYEDLAVG